jgi:hypothetical protein
MGNLTLTIQFCDISQCFVFAIKYENTYTSVTVTTHLIFFGRCVGTLSTLK